MRDVHILGSMAKLEGMVGHDMAIMQQTVTLCRTRIDAIEKVLFGFRGSLLMYGLIQLAAPKMLLNLVERWHGHMIHEYNQSIEAARARNAAKILAPKTEITVVK